MGGTLTVDEFWQVIREGPHAQTYERIPQPLDNFELMIRYRSVQGAPYLTRIAYETAVAPHVWQGSDSGLRRGLLWAGMWWRWFSPWVKAQITSTRRKRRSSQLPPAG